jgi:hypothetical protein
VVHLKPFGKNPRFSGENASHSDVHRARPSGGFPQQSAIIFASTSPVIFDGMGGDSLFLRFRTASNPSVAYCLLTWYTVTVLTPHILAASACSRLSPKPSSKFSSIVARVMLRTVCVPLFVIREFHGMIFY